jgi:hypothetical protein
MMSDYSHPIVQWINGQSSGQILDWMRSRLMQRDEVWPQSLHDDEFPFQMIEDLCARDDVQAEKRFYLLDGSMKLLNESIGAGQLNGEWHSDAFSNLCMLLPALVSDPLHKAAAHRLLVGALPSLGEGEAGIQFGNDILRTLVDLGFERPGSFWIGYDIKADATRGTIVFQALQRSDHLTLFAWIAQHDSTNLERLKEVLKRLTRPLQRECEKNLEFAKTLRISLKNLQLDSYADNITQIGIKMMNSSVLLSEVNSKLSQDRRIADIVSSADEGIVEIIFLRKYDGPVQQFVDLINKIPSGYGTKFNDDVKRVAVQLLQYRSEVHSEITVKAAACVMCP